MNKNWHIEWVDSAEKYYYRLQPKKQSAINEALVIIKKNPSYNIRIKKLHGEYEGLYRYRLGSLRIVYRILSDRNTIRLIGLETRGDVYK